MSEYLPLFLLTLQALVYSKVFNEDLCLTVKNSVNIDVRKRSKSTTDEIAKYRTMEKETAHTEEREITKVAETLVMKSQKLPSKRQNDYAPADKLKKQKREYVRVMNEEFPVYKTMQFVDELEIKPIFSREETMPQVHRSSLMKKQCMSYLGIELRVIKISKIKCNLYTNSLQNIILSKIRK